MAQVQLGSNGAVGAGGASGASGASKKQSRSGHAFRPHTTCPPSRTDSKGTASKVRVWPKVCSSKIAIPGSTVATNVLRTLQEVNKASSSWHMLPREGVEAAKCLLRMLQLCSRRCQDHSVCTVRGFVV